MANLALVKPEKAAQIENILINVIYKNYNKENHITSKNRLIKKEMLKIRLQKIILHNC